MSRNKEPTRQQLSSKLAYEKKVPAFIQKLQNKINGISNDDDEEEKYGYEDDEFEHINDGSGRPPIPRRPAIPERPEDDPGSADEDDGDEKPQVVVLREGKHLTEREAENVRRKEKGLAPLPELKVNIEPEKSESKSDSKGGTPSLSFSSSKAGPSKSSKSSGFKRKVLGDAEDRLESSKESKSAHSKKKSKKNNKTLLSFDDDA